jgi:hypothetical protein
VTQPKEHLFETYFAESPAGSGVASAKLLLRTPEESGGLVELTLRWEAESTEGQPDVWQIFYWHAPDVIFWDAIDNYLRRFCPVPAQILQVAHLARMQIEMSERAA